MSIRSTQCFLLSITALTSLLATGPGCKVSEPEFNPGPFELTGKLIKKTALGADDASTLCARVEVSNRIFVEGSQFIEETFGTVRVESANLSFILFQPSSSGLSLPVSSGNLALESVTFSQSALVSIPLPVGGPVRSGLSAELTVETFEGLARDCDSGTGEDCSNADFRRKTFQIESPIKLGTLECGFNYELQLSNPLFLPGMHTDADAGTTDARADASTDAPTTVDAAVADGPILDAPTPVDASVVDAPVVDAPSTVDASVIDAPSTIDASVIDAQ